MATGPLAGTLGFLRRLATPAELSAQSDADLLACFAAERDESAFAALVRRHGPMVLGVCRRVLGHEQDAEDAFQAAFLVLARRAAEVARPEQLGNWLYGVAYRTARKAKALARRRPVSGVRPEGQAVAESDAREHQELRSALDEEIARLPEKYRTAFVLFHLEGHGRAEVARRLGAGEGAVKGLLERARRRLREGLARRGLGEVALPALLAPALVPSALDTSAVRAGVLLAAGAAEALPAEVVALAEGVLQTMSTGKLKVRLAVVFLLGLAGTGAGFFVPREQTPGPGPAPAAKRAPAVEPAVKEFTLRHEGVSALACSPDGSVLATGGKDGGIRLWDAGTGREAKRLKGHKGAVRALCFAPGGKLLASGGADGDVFLWSLPPGKRVAQITAHPGEVRSLSFSPDGKSLATAGGDGKAFLWEVSLVKEAAKEAATWKGQHLKEGLSAVVFSADGRHVLLAGRVTLNRGAHWVRLYLRDVRTGKDDASFEGPEQDVRSLPEAAGFTVPVALGTAGKEWVAAVGDGKVVRLWGGKRRGPALEGHTARVTALLFLPGGKTLVSGSLDGTIRFWDTKGKEKARVDKQGEVLALALAPGRRVLASAHADGTVRVRDVGKLMRAGRVKEKERPAK